LVPGGRPGGAARGPAEVIAGGPASRACGICADLKCVPLDLLEVAVREAAPAFLHLKDELEHRAIAGHRDAVVRGEHHEPTELRLRLGLALADREVDPGPGALLERI